MTTGTVYRAESPFAALILAHGAGAGQKSPWIVKAANAMTERGVTCITFDFPYITAGKKVADRAPVLENHWRRVLDDARGELHGLPIFIGGKSMGGRIASHVAAQPHDAIAGLVFLGYPLHPPGRPTERRDAHLPDIREPMLFVQGTRDAFGTAEEIRSLLPGLHQAALREVEGGDHSFKVSGRGAPKPDVILDRVLDQVRDWIHGVCSAKARMHG